MHSFCTQAPTRIDLAGGTLDFWPLYLFIPEARTVNLGIDLFARTCIESIDSTHIRLESVDQQKKIDFKWNADARELANAIKDKLNDREIPAELELHAKYLLHWIHHENLKIKGGFTLRTEAKSPAGAGLGGSSSLSISILGALETLSSGTLEVSESLGWKLIETARDIETTVIKVPAGMQDYYGATFGGLQTIHWNTREHSRKRYTPNLAQQISDRLVLFYSGKSRNSGINNWILYKSFIDGDSHVRKSFLEISSATIAVDKALENTNFDDFEEGVRREWLARQTLCETISTPEIDQAFQIAKKRSVVSGKICGAGGGGCFFFVLPKSDAEKKSSLIEAVSQIPGIRHLPFQPALQGVHLG